MRGKSRYRNLIDIEKAFCFFVNKKHSEIISMADIVGNSCSYERRGVKVEEWQDDKWVKIETVPYHLKFNTWYKSEFFKFKGFKKGTLHLEFLDDKLYQDFNHFVCASKNWIPNETSNPAKEKKSRKSKQKENKETSKTVNNSDNKEVNDILDFLNN